MQVKWHSDREPWKGFEYVFLTDEDYQACLEAHGGDCSALPFRAEHMQEACPPHWRITDIIGARMPSASLLSLCIACHRVVVCACMHNG